MPLVYDVHHHRCYGDGLEVEAVTELAVGTWDRERLFHVSSPREGWRDENPRSHGDQIRLRDFPRCWVDMDGTVEVEAKAKELAVLELRRALERRATRRAALAARRGPVSPRPRRGHGRQGVLITTPAERT